MTNRKFLLSPSAPPATSRGRRGQDIDLHIGYSAGEGMAEPKKKRNLAAERSQKVIFKNP